MIFYLNTTLVSLKQMQGGILNILLMHLNTTLVSLKLVGLPPYIGLVNDLNTTLVSLKPGKIGQLASQRSIFKYNSCFS